MTDLETEAWVRAHSYRIQRDAESGDRAAKNVIAFKQSLSESGNAETWLMFCGAVEAYRSRKDKKRRGKR